MAASPAAAAWGRRKGSRGSGCFSVREAAAQFSDPKGQGGGGPGDPPARVAAVGSVASSLLLSVSPAPGSGGVACLRGPGVLRAGCSGAPGFVVLPGTPSLGKRAS